LFGAQSRSWTPLENEFLAENELIEIVPNFSCPKRDFIQGSFGPFHPNRVIAVPLWLATTLKKSKKCSIKTPKWMEEEELRNILEQEKVHETFYHGLPFYYREISKMVFDVDSSCNQKQVRVLLQDIEDVRESKTKKGMKQLEASSDHLHLNHISANQLNKNIRVNVCDLLTYFHDINRAGHQADASSSQSQLESSRFGSQSQSALNTSSVSQMSAVRKPYRPQDHRSNDEQENEFNLSNKSSIDSQNGQPMRKLRRFR